MAEHLENIIDFDSGKNEWQEVDKSSVCLRAVAPLFQT